jgi:hypothetical protein
MLTYLKLILYKKLVVYYHYLFDLYGVLYSTALQGIVFHFNEDKFYMQHIVRFSVI